MENNGKAPTVRYYTTTQVAKLLGFSRQTVLRMVKAGKLESCKTPGGFHRIPAREVSRLYEEPGNVRLPQQEILVAFDDERVLSLVLRVLDSTALDTPAIRTATSGIESLIAIGESLPDLFILDLEMRDLDCVWACRRLRERFGRTLRIIGISYIAAMVNAERLGACGCDALFPKPFSIIELLHAVRELTATDLEA